MQFPESEEVSQASQVLPCTLHPKKDELLSSWLVRLAYAHQLKVYSFCRHLWPGGAVWNRDIDKLAPAVLLDTLAARTLTPAHRIAQTTLPPLVEHLNGTPLTSRQAAATWLMPVGIYHRTHRDHGLVYCSHCLRQDGPDPYYRTCWRIAFHVLCPTCGIYLHEGCPACGKPVNFFRIELGRKSAYADRSISTCHHCAFDLTESPVEYASPKTLRRFRALYRISQEGWKTEVPYPHQYLRVLRQIIRVLTSSSERVRPLQVDMRLRLGQPLVWPAEWASFEQTPLRWRICLLQQAMWLLDDWPNRFSAVVRYHQLGSSSLLKDMGEEIPFWFDSIIKNNFYTTNASRRYGPPAPQRAEQGKYQFIAPIKGKVGGPRKYDKEHKCPSCNSDWVSRNGFRRNRQRYECQQCRRNFC